MKKNKTNLIEVNNDILKRTNNIISITNKLVDKLHIPNNKDFEWWDNLENYWKKELNYQINKPEHNNEISVGNKNTKFLAEYGSIERPNNSELSLILNLSKIWMSTYEASDFSILKQLKKLDEICLWRQPKINLDSFQDLKNLAKLNLGTWNYIDDLSPLMNIPNLKDLVLHEYQINERNLKIISELKNLSSLTLSMYNISDGNTKQFIKTLIKLPLLEVLNFYGHLNSLENFEYLINLKKLDLSCNEISDISYLTSLINLKELDLSYNPIEVKDILNIQLKLPNCKITFEE